MPQPTAGSVPGIMRASGRATHGDEVDGMCMSQVHTLTTTRLAVLTASLDGSLGPYSDSKSSG